MTRILVTGGFGFLGTHVVEALITKSDHQVHVVDNLSTSPVNVDDYLDEIGRPKNLTYTIASIADWWSRVEPERFDQIYHLASVVGPVGVLPHAGRIVQAIVEDSYRIVDLALRWRARLVDVSTSEVYGGTYQEPCTEEHPKCFPAETSVRMEYAVGKLAVEIALVNVCRVRELDACIVRPFNIAGPRQSGKGGFVLPRFVEQALRDEPLTVFGNGSQVRAFTHVTDVASGVILTMERGRRGEIYNVGNPANKITIWELAQRVIKLASSRSEIQRVDPQTLFGPLYTEVGDKQPDASKITRELGWAAHHDIDRVIRDTIAYMRPRVSASPRRQRQLPSQAV